MNSKKTTQRNTGFRNGPFIKIMGVLILFVCTLLLFIGSIIANNKSTLKDLLLTREQLRTSQQEVYNSLLVFEKHRSWRNLKIATDKVYDDMTKNNDDIEQTINTIEARYHINSIMSVAFGIFALVLLIYAGRVLRKNMQHPYPEYTKEAA